MKMKPTDNLPDSFQARRYRPGTVDADPVTAKINSDQLLIRHDDGSSFAFELEQLDIKLGGANGDRIVFSNATTGDTIIVRDITVLKALKQTSRGKQLQKQVSKIRSTQSLQKVQQIFAMIGVVFMCLMYGGCVFIGMVLEPIRKMSETNNDQPDVKSSTNNEPGQVDQLSDDQRAQIEENYQRSVKDVIMRAWKLPADNSKTNAIVVRTKIDGNGIVKSFSVSESSGDVDLDNSAVQAVKAASPLPVPPRFWPRPVEMEVVLNPAEIQRYK